MILGKIFTNGNINELPIISEKLYSLGIEHTIGRKIIYFNSIEVSKLPKDDKGYYLPFDDNSGYSFYEIFDEDLINYL
jgi:hypothetical protein